MRPVDALRAYMARRDREEAWQVYMAEQMWMLNQAMYHGKYGMPRFHEMIEEESGQGDAMKASDEKEKNQVHAWLMGGDGYGSIHAGGQTGA